MPLISARCVEAVLALLSHQSIRLFAYLGELLLGADSREQAVTNTCTCFTFTSSGIPDKSQKGLAGPESADVISRSGDGFRAEQRAEDFHSCLAQFRLGRRTRFIRASLPR